jgi:hypothetical protein
VNLTGRTQALEDLAVELLRDPGSPRRTAAENSTVPFASPSARSVTLPANPVANLALQGFLQDQPAPPAAPSWTVPAPSQSGLRPRPEAGRVSVRVQIFSSSGCSIRSVAACYQAPSRAIAHELTNGIRPGLRSHAAIRGLLSLASRTISKPEQFGRAGNRRCGRRLKIIPNGFGEKPILKLMFGALIRAAERWRGLRFTEFDFRQIAAFARNSTLNT